MTLEERAEAFIGQRFGYLTVTGVVGLRAPRGGKRKQMYVTCDCACGRKDYIIMLHSLRYGKSVSCGCARVYKTEINKPLDGLGIDLSISRISNVWDSLEKDQLCKAWQDVKKFAEWSIRNGFTKDRELKRRDPAKPFNPLNAYWG